MASILKVNTIQDATNSNTAISVDSSGRVSLPLVPAFRVGLTNSQSITTANSNIDIEWNEGTSSDNDNCFSQGGFSWSSGIVTVPISGVYQFDTSVRLDNVGSGYVVLKMVRNNDGASNKEYFSIDGDLATNYGSLVLGGVFKLTASDTVRVTIFADSDSSYSVNNASIFSGHFVG